MTTTVDPRGANHRPPPWVRRAILTWWATGAGLWLLYFFARELRSLLVQVVLALFLSFAIEPIVDRLERRGVKRGVGTLAALLFVLLVLIAFMAAMGSLIADQLNQLIDDLPGYLTSTQGWLDDTLGIVVSVDDLQQQLQPGGEASRFATGLAGNLVEFGTTIANVLFQAITIVIFAFYFAADGPRLRRSICSLFPPQRQHEILRIWELAINKTGAYIASRLILAVISGIFHWIVFSALGLPSSVALALWVGVISQFIPAIGVYLAGVLPTLVAVGIDPSKALWVIVAVIAYQQVENYVLQPRITAQTLDMHPAVAIAAVVAGTTLFGIAGALLALPVVATVSGFFTAYIERHEVVDNDLLGSSDDEPPRRRADDHPTTLSGTDPADAGLEQP